MTLQDAKAWHRPRPKSAHKGNSGHVLVVGGSPGMAGAAVLACWGALRAGAGRVSCVKLEGGALPPEVTVSQLRPDALVAFAAHVKITAVVLGPGLAVDDLAHAWVTAALAWDGPLVLDAGALTALGTGLDRLTGRTAPTVLTPHPGELARLLGSETHLITGDRIGHALGAAHKSGATVIHKGARSVVAAPSGESFVVMAGHPVLATGGTGDVLAGVVGALLGKGHTGLDAARLGALLHGCAGDLCAQVGPQGILASEVAAAVPRVLAQLELP